MKGRPSFQTQNNLWVWILMFLLPRRYWYRNYYLRSKHWRELRRKKLHVTGYKCHGCGRKGYFDIHHLTYKRIWHERLSDLQVLCRSCHKKEHE